MSAIFLTKKIGGAMSDAFWIITTGSLVAVIAALLGTFLVLRKMTMIGDAISHAVLPGLVVAYLFTGSLSSIPMLIGAAAVGMLATFLIETFHTKGKLQSDASIGMTFTWLFAVGVIMISSMTGQVDLDLDCVLYGEIAYVPLDLPMNAQGDIISYVPRQVWILGGTLALVLGFVVIGFKGLKLTTFDPAYATAVGINTMFWHYALMGAVSLSTVTAFDSVGAILVVAFLTGPAATAYLLTDNLKRMLVIAALMGVLASIGGYYLAYVTDGSIAGAMAVATGVEFLLAFLFSPKHGIFFRNRRAKNKQPISA